MARLALPKMTELLGKPVIVENRPGATGTIGTDLVAKGSPDGHTFLLTPNQPMVIAPALFKVPYDPARDLDPIALVGEGTNVLMVNPALGINSVADLIAAAKAKPGTLTYSSSGPGSISHLCGELLSQVAGISVVHVPYKGASQAATSVATGEVSFGFQPMQQGMPLVKSGKTRGLGVTSREPSRFLPDLKPLVAQGLNGVISVTWFGAYVSPKTPGPVVQILHDALKKVFQDPDISQKLANAAIETRWDEADRVTALINTELALWRKIVKTGNIQGE